MPRLLDRAEVPAANTLNFTVINVGTVVGPLLAGVLVAGTGGYAVGVRIDARAVHRRRCYAALRLPPLPPHRSPTVARWPGSACARCSTGCASSRPRRCC